jgi:hypothetical protein
MTVSPWGLLAVKKGGGPKTGSDFILGIAFMEKSKFLIREASI